MRRFLPGGIGREGVAMLRFVSVGCVSPLCSGCGTDSNLHMFQGVFGRNRPWRLITDGRECHMSENERLLLSALGFAGVGVTVDGTERVTGSIVSGCAIFCFISCVVSMVVWCSGGLLALGIERVAACGALRWSCRILLIVGGDPRHGYRSDG